MWLESMSDNEMGPGKGTKQWDGCALVSVVWNTFDTLMISLLLTAVPKQ